MAVEVGLNISLFYEWLHLEHHKWSRCAVGWFISFYRLFLDLRHLRGAASLDKNTTDLEPCWCRSLRWCPDVSVQRKATSRDFCSSSNKSVTTKPVRFREERRYFTSALPRSDALTRPQLLSVMAPVQPPWRQNLFRRTKAFIWNLTQESVGITKQQICTTAKEIWRFSGEPSLLSQLTTGLLLLFPLWEVLRLVWYWTFKHRHYDNRQQIYKYIHKQTKRTPFNHIACVLFPNIEQYLLKSSFSQSSSLSESSSKDKYVLTRCWHV